MNFNRLIIDGDSLLWRCGCAAEGEPIENALHNFKSRVQDIERATQCPVERIYIKGEGNFRDAVAISKPYKGNRATPKPTNFEELVEYAMKYWKAVKVDGMEADDICSVQLWDNQTQDSGFVLAAMDKDLWNTPGWHYNYHPKHKTLEYVSVARANRNFITQLLSGDTTDNIPGLPKLVTPIQPIDPRANRIKPKGIGKGTAEKFLADVLLHDNRKALQLVWDAYQWYGMEVGWSTVQALEYFVEQGRLLWMTRELHPDGSPRLWEAPEWLLEDTLALTQG